MTTSKGLAVGYCRVSTDEQAREGVSLDAQADRITKWAELHEQPLVSIHRDEGISGKGMDNRPGLLAAISAAKSSRAALVVYSLSRLSRSTRDTIRISEELGKAGADIVSISERIDTTTANGKLFFTIMAALAQFERETIAERTQMALDHKRSRGEALGNVPYGFKSSGRRGSVIPNEDEILTLRVMLIHANAFPGRYAAVTEMLNALDFRNRAGTPWDRGSIRRIVKFYDSSAGAAAIKSLIDAGLWTSEADAGALTIKNIEGAGDFALRPTA